MATCGPVGSLSGLSRPLDPGWTHPQTSSRLRYRFAASSTVSEPSRKSRYLLFAIAAVVAVVLDLWTKQWAWNTLRPPEGEAIEVVEHVFYFRYGFNTGAAFSFLRDSAWSRPFFIVVTLFALGYMGWMLRTMPAKRGYGFLAVGLIAGGALGNLFDRITRVDTVRIGGEMVERHGVVDFLQFYYNWEAGDYWPIFNIADTALCVGVGLLLIYLHKQGKEDAAAEKAAAAAA